MTTTARVIITEPPGLAELKQRTRANVGCGRLSRGREARMA